MTGSQVTRVGVCWRGVPSSPLNRAPSRVTTTISPSSMKITLRVCASMAGTSLATKYSPSPSPTTIGGPLRTATSFSGRRPTAGRARTARARGHRPPHRAFEPIVLPLLLHEVGDDFGVGFRLEDVSLRRQLPFQLEVVLDDAVVHHHDPAAAVPVRVGVLLRWPAVRRPTRVAEAVLAVQRALSQRLFEVGQLAGATANVHVAVVDDRDAGRVVATILETSSTHRE